MSLRHVQDTVTGAVILAGWVAIPALVAVAVADFLGLV